MQNHNLPFEGVYILPGCCFTECNEYYELNALLLWETQIY